MRGQVKIESQEWSPRSGWKPDLEVIGEEFELTACLVHRNGKVEPGVIVTSEVRKPTITFQILFSACNATGIRVEPSLTELFRKRWLRIQYLDQLVDFTRRCAKPFGARCAEQHIAELRSEFLGVRW